MAESGPRPAVLRSISEVSNAWLAAALETPVQGFAYEEIVGEGFASQMYRIRVRYSPPATGPATVILKLVTTQPQQQGLHNLDTLFREVQFYSTLAHRLSDVTPVVYFSSADVQSRQLSILLEDIGEIPHKPFAASLSESLAAMRALALVHAAYWQDDILNEDALIPLESAVSVDGLVDVVRQSMAVEQQADYSFPYLNACMRPLPKLARFLVTETARSRDPQTLVHGDFHTRNVHALPERFVVFDWQQAERGNPMRDVIYWLLTSVEVDDAESFEQQMFATYRAGLASAGIVYSDQQFRRDLGDAVAQMIPRMYCFQVLITLGERDKHELVRMLTRTEALARRHHFLALMRVAQVVAPISAPLLRWLR